MGDQMKRGILDQWLWEPGPVKLFVAIWVCIPVVLTGVFYAFQGTKALYVLIFTAMGPLFWLVFGSVGKKVENLCRSTAPDEGSPIQSLIVSGMIQSPGIALLKNEELVLRPIVGSEVSVRFADMESVNEVRFFNGKLLIGKTGFWLSVPGRKRLGVAVPNSVADLLREQLGK